MRVGIVINPIAGGVRRRNASACVALARRVLAERQADGDVRVTERPGHARDLARDLLDHGAETVVAWGGDGTVNEVASQLAFTNATLGIVAAGSGNGLARELGIPRRARAALATALSGAVVHVDAGELASRLFFNVGGMGFDAVLAEQVNRASRRGRLMYVSAGVRTLLRYQPQVYTVRAHDTTISQRALVVAVANTRQYGNQAVIAPRARLDDGWLDIVVVPALSLPAMLWHAPRLFTGTLDRMPGLDMARVQSVEIETQRPLTFHVDGEVARGGTSVSARVHANALRVRAVDPATRGRSGAG